MFTMPLASRICFISSKLYPSCGSRRGPHAAGPWRFEAGFRGGFHALAEVVEAALLVDGIGADGQRPVGAQELDRIGGVHVDAAPLVTFENFHLDIA